MVQITTDALNDYVEESVEDRGLSSTREICIALKVSQSMNLPIMFI